MAADRSDAIVIFGASGDLVYKKIFPALQAQVRRGQLPVPVIGVARTTWDLPQFQARVQDSLAKHGGLDSAAFDQLRPQLRYIAGDYADPDTYARLCEALGGAERPLYYLALPPSVFPSVIEGLAKTGCARDARVVLEKPFGRNLATARELNHTLHARLPEKAIYRIDHYLGKEPVQNLVYFRFANPFIDTAWSNKQVESVQITMAESFGVEGRGSFYEEAGAIRDVVQNHMLQVVACIAMEPQTGKGDEALRDERDRLLRSVRTLVPSNIVRGQYRGYREEKGVAADSQVETFVATRFHIDNARWDGVPFHVRAGKRLPVTATEVLVRFKPSVEPVLEDAAPLPSSYHRFRFSPEVAIAMGTLVKKPGERMDGERVELVACHQSPDDMGAYERLLSDAANGDATLFIRQDSVEESWRIVDPVLGAATPLHEYEQGTWGPAEANGPAIAPAGGWHDPAAKHACG